MLVGAYHEAIREILEELEPFRLDRTPGAVGEWRVFAGLRGIDLDVHVKVRVRLQQTATQLRSAIPGVIPAGVRPNDVSVRIVRQQPLEGGNVGA